MSRPKDILLGCENLILIIKSERSGMVACSCDPGYLGVGDECSRKN
jgi:hypothetical protein